MGKRRKNAPQKTFSHENADKPHYNAVCGTSKISFRGKSSFKGIEQVTFRVQGEKMYHIFIS